MKKQPVIVKDSRLSSARRAILLADGVCGQAFRTLFEAGIDCSEGVGLARNIVENARRIKGFDDNGDTVFESCAVGEARDDMVERSPFGGVALLDQIDRIGDRLVATPHFAGDEQALRGDGVVADLLLGSFIASRCRKEDHRSQCRE